MDDRERVHLFKKLGKACQTPKERKRPTEFRAYDVDSPLNRQALETVSVLREALESQEGSYVFTLYFDEPPYFQTRETPLAWGLRAIIFFTEEEKNRVSVTQEKVELYYSPDEVDDRPSYVEALDNDRLGSVTCEFDAEPRDGRPRISENPRVEGEILIEGVKIIDWKTKEEASE